jgi:hypothetical protein
MFDNGALQAAGQPQQPTRSAWDAWRDDDWLAILASIGALITAA